MMRSLTVVLFGFAGANFLGDDGTCGSDSCDSGVECCQVIVSYLPAFNTFECCTHGSCIPNVGCRCREGELCDEEKAAVASFLGDDGTCSSSSCDGGVECCQVTDTTFECCTHGSCIPHVGCRCREGELCDEEEEKAAVATFLGDDGTCSSSSCDSGVECCQVTDTTFECCTHGSCIPHVGCRCREGELCDEEEEKAAVATFLDDDGTCSSNSCDSGVECCQVTDTTFECCTHGSCIPHVGCRCREGELCDEEEKAAEANSLGDTCSSDSCDAGVECCQLADHFECCTEGNCIPNVGCRCREGELCNKEKKSGGNFLATLV